MAFIQHTHNYTLDYFSKYVYRSLYAAKNSPWSMRRVKDTLCYQKSQIPMYTIKVRFKENKEIDEKLTNNLRIAFT